MCATEGGSGQGLGLADPQPTERNPYRQRPTRTDRVWVGEAGQRISAPRRRPGTGPRRPRPRGMLSEAENRCFLQVGRKKGEIEENQPLADLQPRGRAHSRLQVGTTAPAAAELGS